MKLLARSSLKKPFVKTVASVAMLGGAAAAGCTGGTVDGGLGTTPTDSTGCPEAKPTGEGACNLPASTACGYDDCYGTPSTTVTCEDGTWKFSKMSCNPPEPACPEAAPTSDAACAAGQSFDCNYGDCYGSPTKTASCKDGKWEVIETSCNPPPPSCPDAKPADDAACPAYLESVACGYDLCYDAPTTTATCKDGKWHVEQGPTCNPPPPCPATKPNEGAACTADEGTIDGHACEYDDCNGTPSTTATCEDGKWKLVTKTCNPPPPQD